MTTIGMLGRVRAWDVAGAAALMAVALILAFGVFVFVTIPGETKPSWYFAIAIAAFLASAPLRRRGAELGSILVGTGTTTILALITAWFSALPEIRAFGPPQPFAILLLLAVAAPGALTAFRIVSAV